MKTAWKKGLSKERADEVAKDFDASAIMRARLKELLEERSRSSHAGSISKDAYSSPNWAYLQADARGYERAISEILSLIEK
jgi:hypothetical protein